MKTLALLFSLCTLHSFSQITFNPNTLSEIAKDDRDAHAGMMMGNIRSERSALSDYDVKHYTCHWTVDPAVYYIYGSVTTQLLAVNGDLDSITFDLSDNLDIESIIFHDQTCNFSHSDNRLQIELPQIIPAFTTDEITVNYYGEPAGSGLGSFTQNDHNGVPIIWTLSEPYGASDWWPCKNDLTDKADSLDVYITTPISYTAVSNGVLADTTTGDANHVFHWQHRYPIAAYLVCMATTNYAQYVEWVPFNSENLMIQNFVYPEEATNAANQTDELIPVMQLYDSLFGIYPFQAEKYGHAQFGWGGGMEHQTMTFVSNFGFELLAHELAHHWFGDKITCGTWRDIWLNEGFATYLSGLCYEHLAPQYWDIFKISRINNITSQPDGSVWCDDTTNTDRIFDGRLTYAKGGMILHQLRWVVGDENFYQAVNNYLHDETCAYEFALTGDLISHFEATTGTDLDWYFDDWYTGEGYPSYQFTWTQNADLSIAITVDQTQSDPSVDFFQLPLPLRFFNETQDTIIVVNHTQPSQWFWANLDFVPDSMEFDPEHWIISRNNDIVAGVKEFSPATSWKIFPNPADDKIQIQFRNNQNVSGEIQVTDLSGRIVKRSSFSNKSSLAEDVSDLSSGVYMVEIKTGEGNGVERLVIR